jgi:hypothetical protein
VDVTLVSKVWAEIIHRAIFGSQNTLRLSAVCPSVYAEPGARDPAGG